MSSVYIGTSGWVYKHWHQTFYPAGAKGPRLLKYYAERFPTVEINASFYRLPTPKAIQEWKSQAPPEFVYAVKGSRFITHMKKLKDVRESTLKFVDLISPLGEHLGPFLWQLPPNLHRNPEKLESFLKDLPGEFMHAVEFRHSSWYDEEIFQLLEKHGAALVWLSARDTTLRFNATANFIYLRFHGLEGGYAHDYSREELLPWAEQLKNQAANGRKAFVYFNNDGNARAPENARMLMEMVQPFSVFSAPVVEMIT